MEPDVGRVSEATSKTLIVHSAKTVPALLHKAADTVPEVDALPPIFNSTPIALALTVEEKALALCNVYAVVLARMEAFESSLTAVHRPHVEADVKFPLDIDFNNAIL